MSGRPAADDPRGVAVVAGAGGFIGGHLVAALQRSGTQAVRAIDIKPPHEWQQLHPDAENLQLDLSDRDACDRAVRGATDVYDLAADMGGMGFIESNKALCMLSVLIGTHLLVASSRADVDRFFFASSACVYAADKQASPVVEALRESDAYPAMPEDGYGWEKLFMERMCRHFSEDFGLETRVARFHNVYGPYGSWQGGREKAPAAICRKVAEAVLTGRREIEVWGDGKQSRSFTYIDDCLDGTAAIMASATREPLNVGSDELVTIDELVDVVEVIAGVRLRRRYDLSAPQGVRGRNSDNTLVEARTGWRPSVRLEAGMELTYRWVFDQLADSTRRAAEG
jgi:nucleoside-diphosphate-sugar epimerase